MWNLQRKTCARVSFLQHSAILKEDSGTSVFLWILKFFKNNIFCWKMPSSHCFCSLKHHSESIQNLPLECCYNNFKTPAKKFVLVKFQTCIGNWQFQVVLSNNFFQSIFTTPFHGCYWLFILVLWFLFLICYNFWIAKIEDSNNT